MGATLHELLQELSDQVPGCRHTSVIDSRTGLALAAESDTDPLDAAGADAFHSDLYRLSAAVLEGTPLAGQTEEVVLDSEDATFVSAPIGETGYLWLVVTERATTVGFVQALMRKYSSRLEELIQPFI